MELKITDGGRAESGFQGTTGDCVTRAISIATGKSYQDVYDTLTWNTQEYSERHRDKFAKAIKSGKRTARTGVFKKVYDLYLDSLGWEWTPTMQIGSGCKVHLKASELPKGKLIVRLSRHIATVIDGVLHDTYDCSRDETRCVYGYYKEKTPSPENV